MFEPKEIDVLLGPSTNGGMGMIDLLPALGQALTLIGDVRELLPFPEVRSNVNIVGRHGRNQLISGFRGSSLKFMNARIPQNVEDKHTQKEKERMCLAMESIRRSQRLFFPFPLPFPLST